MDWQTSSGSSDDPCLQRPQLLFLGNDTTSCLSESRALLRDGLVEVLWMACLWCSVVAACRNNRSCFTCHGSLLALRTSAEVRSSCETIRARREDTAATGDERSMGTAARCLIHLSSSLHCHVVGGR
jgi:hypothetical protein